MKAATLLTAALAAAQRISPAFSGSLPLLRSLRSTAVDARVLASDACPPGTLRSSACTNCDFEAGDLSGGWVASVASLASVSTEVSTQYPRVQAGTYAAKVDAGAANTPITLTRTFYSVSPGAVLYMWSGA